MYFLNISTKNGVVGWPSSGIGMEWNGMEWNCASDLIYCPPSSIPREDLKVIVMIVLVTN